MGVDIDKIVRVVKKGKKRIESKVLRDHLAGITQQRSDGDVCEYKSDIGIETWLKMADAANALMDEIEWMVSSPNTMAEWSLIYEILEKARKGNQQTQQTFYLKNNGVFLRPYTYVLAIRQLNYFLEFDLPACLLWRLKK